MLYCLWVLTDLCARQYIGHYSRGQYSTCSTKGGSLRRRESFQIFCRRWMFFLRTVIWFLDYFHFAQKASFPATVAMTKCFTTRNSSFILVNELCSCSNFLQKWTVRLCKLCSNMEFLFRNPLLKKMYISNNSKIRWK